MATKRDKLIGWRMKKIALLFFIVLSARALNAQSLDKDRLEALEERTADLEKDMAAARKVSISGYFQMQYQWGQKDASLKVGDKNHTDEAFNRIGIRRGRIKIAYREKIVSGEFEVNMTEKGLSLTDAYIVLKDPWVNSLQLGGGVFNRPFGFEVAYSSSSLESLERSMVVQTLFPEERDLGGMVVLQAPAESPWSIVKLEAGLFAGNGIKLETDNKRDFIGHLSVAKECGRHFSFGAGVSYYYGYVYQGTTKVYTMADDGFVLSDREANRGAFAMRRYVGFDARMSVKSAIGRSSLYAEYIFGRQPGTESGSMSPNSSKLPDSDTYLRDFGGGYVMFVHDIADTPVSVVLKYDWYDPNTRIAGNAIGANHTGKADIAMDRWGFGALWQINKRVRVAAYYELNRNETSANLDGMARDLKDNVFTFRLQYKF